MDREIIIVGAGPVGLTAALLLGKAGRSVLVLERDAALHTEWRASTFHPPSLEMAEEMGIVGDMLAQGVIAPKYQIRDWSKGRAAEFDFGVLADVTKYPFRLQLEQYKYAAILFEALKRYPNVEVKFAAPVVSVRNNASAAEVDFTSEGKTETLTTQWLLGADGANSIVRRGLGLGFEGSTYPMRFLLLSVDAPLDEWYPEITYVNYVADAQESPGMILRIPDLWRVSFTIPDDVTDEEAKSDAYVVRRLRRVFADREMPLPSARQVFRVHKRAAETFKLGRALLLGDAAHNNSPHGGMGLNSGIHDAYDLASVFAEMARGCADETALQAWADRRREVALHDVQRVADQNTQQFGAKDENTVAPALQRAMTIAADPGRAREWMLEASMLSSVRRWYAPSGRAHA